MGGTPVDVLARQEAAAARSARAAREGFLPGAGGEILQTQISVPPPEIVQYPEAAALFLDGVASIAPTTLAVVATHTLAQGDVGVIRSIVLFGVNLTTAVNARWRVVVNGGVVEGYDRAIAAQNSASAVEGWGPDEVLIRLSPGATVELVIEVIAAPAPLTLGMQAAGWAHPFTLRDRYADAWKG